MWRTVCIMIFLSSVSGMVYPLTEILVSSCNVLKQEYYTDSRNFKAPVNEQKPLKDRGELFQQAFSNPVQFASRDIIALQECGEKLPIPNVGYSLVKETKRGEAVTLFNPTKFRFIHQKTVTLTNERGATKETLIVILETLDASMVRIGVFNVHVPFTTASSGLDNCLKQIMDAMTEFTDVKTWIILGDFNIGEPLNVGLVKQLNDFMEQKGYSSVVEVMRPTDRITSYANNSFNAVDYIFATVNASPAYLMPISFNTYPLDKNQLLRHGMGDNRRAYFSDHAILNVTFTLRESNVEAKTKQAEGQGQPLSSSTMLIIEKGDITKMRVDAIVNAANKTLLGLGGVSGAIFKAAGDKQLEQSVKSIFSLEGGVVRCSTGDACITPAFKLTETQGVKYIIHAVGPDCREVEDPAEQHRLLYNAYCNSLKVADEQRGEIQSIAFPFISSAIFACPKEQAALIALEAISDYVVEHPNTAIRTVRMVLFSDTDKALFDDINAKMFRLTPSSASKLQAQSKSNQEQLKSFIHIVNTALLQDELASVVAPPMLLNRVPTLKGELLKYAGL